MSRSGYSYDLDSWDLIRYRGAVASAIGGKRGQSLLIEMRDALDAMRTKALITQELIQGGEVCALGCVGLNRGLDMTPVDPEDYGQIATLFGVSRALVREIESVNDDDGFYKNETPGQRWVRVRKWVNSQIKATPLSK